MLTRASAEENTFSEKLPLCTKMWWKICLSHLHLRDKSGAFLKAQRIVTILYLTNVKRARSTWMWCESLLINKPSEKICAVAPLTDGKTSEMTNRGKPCLIFFSSLPQSLTHTSYVFISFFIEAARCKRQTCMSFTWRGHTDHAEHCSHHQRGVMSQIGVCWIWIWGHHKKREGNCLHCVRVQQRRLSWTDCTGCWPKDTGHNRWFVRLFQDTGLDDWTT